MAKTILSSSHSNTEPGTTVAGTTEFWLFGYASFEKSTTESTREVTYRAPGTLSKLYVRLTANTTSTNGSVTIRKNGVDTALSVTVTAGSGAVVLEDTSNTVSIAAGDKLCIKTVSAGTGTFTMTIVSCIWDATTNCNVRYVAKGYSITTASASHFLPIAGDRSGTNSAEANAENTIKTAGTIKNGSVNITSNARTNNTTFTVRKNRADTAMIISAGSGVTGHREDTSNSISYAADDELDWEITTLTGTQALVANSYAVDYETTTNNGVLTRGCVGSTADYIVPSLTTWYVPIGGGAAEGVTTESQVQMKAREAFTFRNLIVYSGTNNVTTNSFVNFRVNGVSSALTVTIGPAATGFIADTTHTVTVAAGDLIDFQFVMNGAAVQSMTCRQISITTELAGGQNIVRALATETVTISEIATARTVAKSRALTQTVTVVEQTKARQTNKNRSLALQTVSISEFVQRIKGKVKTLATETVSIAEITNARQAAKNRAIAIQTVAVVEQTKARQSSKTRALALETVIISESLQRIKGKIKALALETVTVVEITKARMAAKNRPVALQSVSVTEQPVIRIKGKFKTLATEIVTVLETRARQVAKNRAISQSVLTSELLQRQAAKSRAVALQTVAVAENLAVVKGARLVVRALATETVSVLESLVVRRVNKTRTIFQNISTLEQLSRLKAISRTVPTQTVAISEQPPIRGTGRIRILALQSVSVAESLARRTAKSRLVAQVISVNETLDRLVQTGQKNITRAIATQTVTVAENLARQTNKLRPLLTEIISIGEILQGVVTKITEVGGVGGSIRGGGGHSVTKVRSLSTGLRHARLRVVSTVFYIDLQLTLRVKEITIPVELVIKIKRNRMPVRAASLPIRATPVPRRKTIWTETQVTLKSAGLITSTTQYGIKVQDILAHVSVSRRSKMTKLTRLLDIFMQWVRL